MLHRGQQLSAATARNDLAITEWRLSARSAGSDDVRDDSQPLDRADQAATARDGMCQLWMSLEGQPGEHGHHRNAHRLDTSIRHANVSHPTTKACLPRVEHVRFIPPCLRCRCRDCPAHPQTATRESQPEITPGWTQGGEAPSGAAPPSHHPKPPPTTRAHSAGRPKLETVGRGEGGLSRSPGTGQREWGLPIPAPGSRTLHAFKGAAADYSGREPYPPRHPACPPFSGIKGPGEAG